MRLGKSQLALLLIVDQSGEHGRVFSWEESIFYQDVDGTSQSYYVMTSDLKVLSRLADRGLLEPDSVGYSRRYTITDAGRRAINARREWSKP